MSVQYTIHTGFPASKEHTEKMGMREIRCGGGCVGHRTGTEAPGPQGDESDTGIPRSRDAQVLIPSGEYILLGEVLRKS